MKTAWDYTHLAQSYTKRPDYSPEVIDSIISSSNINTHSNICDIGAGTANLTLPLLERSFTITSIEPNDAMRAIGKQRTETLYDTVRWVEGTGEETGMPDNNFDMASFGSSFNVTDRPTTLKETYRILKPNGWFVCLWNHRNLDDPIQKEVEEIIKKFIPEYGYGSRREDQTNIINESGLFNMPQKIEGNVNHTIATDEWVQAWKSHATLQRQAGEKFLEIIDAIETHLHNKGTITVPYTTRAWLTQRKD